MGRIGTCNRCGHEQMIGYQSVDGRWKWWTRCEKCKKGDFMSLPDEYTMAFMRDLPAPEEPPETQRAQGGRWGRLLDLPFRVLPKWAFIAGPGVLAFCAGLGHGAGWW